MAEVVLVKFKAKGKRDAGEIPLSASQLTDNVEVERDKPEPPSIAKRNFKKLKKHSIPPERLVSWYKSLMLNSEHFEEY